MKLQTPQGVSIDRKVEIPLGTFPLSYSSRLIRTRADFYDTLKAAAEMAVKEGRIITPATAGEEQAIYAQKSVGTKRLQGVQELKDYFGNNDENWYAWGWTLNGLRFREADLRRSYNIGDKITAEVIETNITPYLTQIADPLFKRENWKDIINEINHVKGEIPVPYAQGHVIKEIHPTLGIFTEIEQTTKHNAPFALHGHLRENLNFPKDEISGHYDLSVWRGGDWLRDEDVGCLYVDAGYGPSDPDSCGGFRPVVRGSETTRKVEMTGTNADIEKIRKDVLKEVAHDLRTLVFFELLEKYQLD